MKKIFISLVMVIAIFTIAINSVAQITGTFTDSRDGKTYKTVVIGTQTWIAENLAYKTSSGCWAYNNDTTNVVKCGYLYNWKTAKVACPAGWHLSTESEWTTLIDYLGGEDNAESKLKSAKDWNGTNESGFTALPAGYSGGGFFYLGNGATFWTDMGDGSGKAWFRDLMTDHGGGFRGDYDESEGFSVRCVKN